MAAAASTGGWWSGLVSGAKQGDVDGQSVEGGAWLGLGGAADAGGVFGLGGWMPAIPSFPGVHFSARGRAPYEPEESTTKDLEVGDADMDAEEVEGRELSLEEGSEQGELMMQQGNKMAGEAACGSSIHSARSSICSGHSAGRHGGLAVRDLLASEAIMEGEMEDDESNNMPLGPFRKRARSESIFELPLGQEVCYQRLKVELWGSEGAHKQGRKVVRTDWQDQYKAAFEMHQESRLRRSNLLCSTEVVNGLCVPFLCFALFIVHMVMSNIIFPKEGEH